MQRKQARGMAVTGPLTQLAEYRTFNPGVRVRPPGGSRKHREFDG
jgi:hypothetical protein